MKRVTRYMVYGNPQKVVERDGVLLDSGEFKYYAGLVGDCTVYQGYHFATKNEAILDSVKEIELDIEVLEKRKSALMWQMEKE